MNAITNYDRKAIIARLRQLGFPDTVSREFGLRAKVKRRSRGNRGNEKLKAAIFKHDFGGSRTGKCHWCRDTLYFRDATVDHEPALAIGGCWGCAFAACHTCNQERADRLREFIKQRNAKQLREDDARHRQATSQGSDSRP